LNRTHLRALYLSILLISQPFTWLHAEDLVMKTSFDKISSFVSDIPCITLKNDAGVEVFLEETTGLNRVYDNTGITYSAATLQDAVDGYLRMRNLCTIKEVKVTGQARISTEAIRFRIKNMPGGIIHKASTRKDIEEIYSMGYFEKVDASFENGIINFSVKEYPVIVTIEVQGNSEINNEDILKAISLKKFDILNTKTLKTSIDRIISLYREKGFFKAEVTSATKETEGGIILTFTVKENNQLYIQGITFDGNENVSSSTLNGWFTGVMQTKTRWWWGLFGHEGAYQEEALDTDLMRIEEHYGNEGYMRARAGRPIVDIKEDKGIYLTIPIEEGPVFSVGKIDIEGDLIKPKEELLSLLQIKEGDVMRRNLVNQSVEAVRDVYLDAGYAYAQIKPDMTEGSEANTVDIKLMIRQGKPVHIDTIHIRGNIKTRDKVIRREIQLDEGDMYSSTKIKQSKDYLNRLGYFSSANIETIPRNDENMSMLVDVEETTTGAFSFGFAYSTVDSLMGTVQLSYSLDFEDPWLFDYHISLGASIFNMERQYTYYTKDSRGGNIRLSYPLFERVRHSIAYSYIEVVGLTDIDDNYENTLTEEEIDGYVTSSVINSLNRDTTNDYFRPTRGSDSSVSLEYAGLGGDYHYTRVTAKHAQFFPLYKDKVALMLKLRWGTINPAMGDKLPEDELFVLGGLNSIRGFRYGDVGPMDSYGNVIGGRRELVFNSEITFPVFDVPGLSGAIFLDQGNAYTKRIDLTNLKRAYGGEFRWVTPMGPLRIAFGKVIHPEEYESPSRWDFSIGTFF